MKSRCAVMRAGFFVFVVMSANVWRLLHFANESFGFLKRAAVEQ